MGRFRRLIERQRWFRAEMVRHLCVKATSTIVFADGLGGRTGMKIVRG